MNTPERMVAAAICILILNLPFGYWRAGIRKFSIPWFVAIHAPVPLAIAIRMSLGLSFRWANVPIFALAYFSGQFLGARLRARQGRGLRNS